MHAALRFFLGVLIIIVGWHGVAIAECTQAQIFQMMDMGHTSDEIKRECNKPSIQSNTDKGTLMMRSNCKATRELGNIERFFTVESAGCEQGFERADSILTLVVQAKGNFSGSLGATFYNSNGNLICGQNPQSPGICDALGYRSSFTYSSWQTSESQTVVIKIPYNATRVWLDFKQNR